MRLCPRCGGSGTTYLGPPGNRSTVGCARCGGSGQIEGQERPGNSLRNTYDDIVINLVKWGGIALLVLLLMGACDVFFLFLK